MTLRRKKKALFLCEVPAVVLDVFTHISLRDDINVSVGLMHALPDWC